MHNEVWGMDISRKRREGRGAEIGLNILMVRTLKLSCILLPKESKGWICENIGNLPPSLHHCSFITDLFAHVTWHTPTGHIISGVCCITHRVVDKEHGRHEVWSGPVNHSLSFFWLHVHQHTLSDKQRWKTEERHKPKKEKSETEVPVHAI